jgi:hypothetical protein
MVGIQALDILHVLPISLDVLLLLVELLAQLVSLLIGYTSLALLLFQIV